MVAPPDSAPGRARPESPQPTIRTASDGDATGVIRLVARCFAAYPGCILDCDSEETGLRAPASRFEQFWVAERGGRIVGTIASAHGRDVDGTRGLELKKLYVHPDERRQGLARRLVDLVEVQARDEGHPRVYLWSDTRFVEAHAFYERLGYVRSGRVRSLGDVSATLEFHYAKDIA